MSLCHYDCFATSASKNMNRSSPNLMSTAVGGSQTITADKQSEFMNLILASIEGELMFIASTETGPGLDNADTSVTIHSTSVSECMKVVSLFIHVLSL